MRERGMFPHRICYLMLRSVSTMKSRQFLLAFLFALILASVIPSENAYGEGFPSLTYLRVERWGQTISIKYCMSVDWHAIQWGETSPSNWNTNQTLGTMNGCNSGMKNMFYQVAGNESLWINFQAWGNGGAKWYSFNLRTNADGSITCRPEYQADTHMVPIPSQMFGSPRNQCGWWDRR